MFYFVQKDYKRERNKYYLLACAGVVAIFLSNVAPIILFTCGLYLAYDYFCVARNRNITPISIVFAIWLSVFSLYYIFFIHGHPTKEIMIQFWSCERAFMPYNPFTSDFYLFFSKSSSEIFTSLYAFETYTMRLIWKIFCGLFVMVGIVVLIKNKRIKIMIFIFTPLLLHLLLSTMHFYPFYSRLILYAMPGILILFAYGFCGIIIFSASMLNTDKIISFTTIACMLFLIGLFVIRGFPLKRFEGRDAIKYVEENIQSTENFHMFSGYLFVFLYYTNIRIISDKMNILNDVQHELTKKYVESWLLNLNNMRKQLFLDKIKTLRGRNWIILSHGPKIIKHLDSLGYKKLKEFKSANTSVYLYDFGEGE
jgi:hypothetical protein